MFFFGDYNWDTYQLARWGFLKPVMGIFTTQTVGIGKVFMAQVGQ